MNFFTNESKSYGEANQKLVNFAFSFLFPNRLNDDALYQSFIEFVNQKYDHLGCAVIWEKSSSPFSSLLGQKEVIITSDCVRVTYDYHLYPQTALAL